MVNIFSLCVLLVQQFTDCLFEVVYLVVAIDNLVVAVYEIVGGQLAYVVEQ